MMANGCSILPEPVFQFIGRFFDAREMKSPHTPHCKDFSCIEQFCCLPDGIQAFNLIPEGIGQFEFRAAGAAGNGLGMVAPAARIAVFLCAGRAHAGNSAIDVRSRSYGISLMMLYRGPQLTQEVAQ